MQTVHVDFSVTRAAEWVETGSDDARCLEVGRLHGATESPDPQRSSSSPSTYFATRSAETQPVEESQPHLEPPEILNSAANRAVVFAGERAAGDVLTDLRAKLGLVGPVRWAVEPPEMDWPLEGARTTAGIPLALGGADDVVRWISAESTAKVGIDDEGDDGLKVLQLLATAAPSNMRPLRLDDTKRDLEAAARGRCVDVRTAATFDEFERALADFAPHIVEVNCHGEAGRMWWGRKGEDVEEVDVVDIVALFRKHPVSLVKLDACHTADAVERGGSIAGDLVRAGVPIVMGWRGTSENIHLMHFNDGFWRAVFGGAGIDEAIFMGRMGIRNVGMYPEWSKLAVFTSTNDTVIRKTHRDEWRRNGLREMERARNAVRNARVFVSEAVNSVVVYEMGMDVDLAHSENAIVMPANVEPDMRDWIETLMTWRQESRRD